MKVLYKEKALSIFKAALYTELTNCSIAAGKDHALPLFSEPSIEADDLDIAELIQKIRLLKRSPKLYTNPKKLQSLEDLVNWALRHNAPHKYSIIIKAIKQTMLKGCSYLLKGISKEAALIHTWANEVQGEIRLSGYKMRFRLLPHTNNVLYTKYKLKYRTEDLVLKQWLKIYPEYSFLFLLPGRTILGNRFAFKDFGPFQGNLRILGRKIASSRFIRHPQRSNLVSNHSQYVNEHYDAPLHLSFKKAVNYVNFYNRIKKGEILL